MHYDWIEIEGGDGFVVIPDLRDSRIIYSEAQDGNMIRRNKDAQQPGGLEEDVKADMLELAQSLSEDLGKAAQ